MDIYGFIDRIKGLCHVYGLSNQASEEEVVRNLFLYKLLNDRFSPEEQRSAGGIYMEEKDLIDNAGHDPDWLNETFQRINTYPENKIRDRRRVIDPDHRLCGCIGQGRFFQKYKNDLFRSGTDPNVRRRLFWTVI